MGRTSAFSIKKETNRMEEKTSRKKMENEKFV